MCECPNPNAAADRQVVLFHRLATRLGTVADLAEVLMDVVDFATAVVACDSCFLYVLEGEELVLRASKNPHPEAVDRLKLKLGEGITGWVAEHREPAAVSEKAYEDPRFQLFNELPEDRFEAFLSVPILSRGRLVGVLNLQHRAPHVHRREEIRQLSTLGFLVGAEVEMARLESENQLLAQQLEERKLVERAKGILQRELKISEPEAYGLLRRESQQRRRSMSQMAEAIVLSDSLRQNSRG